MRIHATTFAASALLLLAGCSAGTGTGSPQNPTTEADQHCVVGTWQLDVADYAAQSEAFVLGLGLPIEGFAMDGTGTITFTADGLVATDIALTTTGTIVAGGTRVPLNQASTYSGSGDWTAGTDDTTLNLANWANVGEPSADGSAPIPAIDYTDIPSVALSCSANDLTLQGPDAPLSALWHR